MAKIKYLQEGEEIPSLEEDWELPEITWERFPKKKIEFETFIAWLLKYAYAMGYTDCSDGTDVEGSLLDSVKHSVWYKYWEKRC